jgi:hypothetical protein
MAGMLLMQTAYSVHKALVPYLPFEIPREGKIVIAKVIHSVEMTMSMPFDDLDSRWKEKKS